MDGDNGDNGVGMGVVVVVVGGKVGVCEERTRFELFEIGFWVCWLMKNNQKKKTAYCHKEGIRDELPQCSLMPSHAESCQCQSSAAIRHASMSLDEMSRQDVA